ncbi:anhydro-N-acetylmuramic acid kinase [Amylibacter sp. SFDW26]|uniref:anhydro-N-acetylmuramic acid kinase n=1 Tax=Amylibacter sp. SFDW26 TaxID=2652722 RepID=UPI0012626E78|nr:anhydro-N-acetylmuramic acid kinase [Amylibacter sp. SFDW26]KAB7615920.1 anhydro-N-acetylmuramic acid kinase [Amylibacter sp. SFDW26]
MAVFDPIWALGLMSGTSMDGVDGAMLMTDGERILAFGDSYFRPYSNEEQATISAAQGLWPDESPNLLIAAESVVRDAHAEVIAKFPDADVVGFHGQTLAHDPKGGRTHQLGAGAQLAQDTGKTVVWDFRTADMEAGGEGAPLAPFFHHACAKQLGMKRPMAFVNLGGVGNVSLVNGSKHAPEHPEALLAFDTGPANAPINDLLEKRLGQLFDENGAVAAKGTVNTDVLEAVFANEYFLRVPPKSLDRNSFTELEDLIKPLSTEDGAATLTALAASCVYASQMHFSTDPYRWLICGGGRKNTSLMNALKQRLDVSVEPVENVGLDGDMLEAQAFAYLAVRVVRGLSTSSPTTTGCKSPVCGGIISKP